MDYKITDTQTAKRGRGRPYTGLAMSNAERQKAYRERKKLRLAALRDPTQPVSSKLIDLSALPAWQRK